MITIGSIIDCPHHALALRVLHSDSFTNVRGKDSNAALTWKMIPKERYVLYGRGDIHGPCVALGDPAESVQGKTSVQRASFSRSRIAGCRPLPSSGGR
jgi:hypothetical protein